MGPIIDASFLNPKDLLVVPFGLQDHLLELNDFRSLHLLTNRQLTFDEQAFLLHESTQMRRIHSL